MNLNFSHYQKAVFFGLPESQIADGGAILTAANPKGKPCDELTNRRLNYLLQHDLHRLGLQPLEIEAGAEDRSHLETSFWVPSSETSASISPNVLASAYRQDAYFLVTRGGELLLFSVTAPTPLHLGKLQERSREPLP